MSKEGATKQVPKVGDAPNTTDEEYWNSGAYKTLVPKSQQSTLEGYTSISMEKDSTNGRYQFILNKANKNIDMADYAGKWLKIAVRASKSNAISSWWTDEDPSEAETVNYYWVKIPEAKLNTVGLEEATDNESANYYYDPRGVDEDGVWEFGTADTTLFHLNVKNKTFEFGTQDYADGYLIKLVGKDNQVQSIYLIPKEDRSAYEVYGVYAAGSTDTSIDYIEGESDVTVNDGNAFDAYTKRYDTLNKGDNSDDTGRVTVDFMGKVGHEVAADVSTDRSITKDLIMNAYLKLSSDGKTIKVGLPDVESMNKPISGSYEPVDITASDYSYTDQITVQAIVTKEHESYYKESDIESMTRPTDTSNDESQWRKSESYTEIEGLGETLPDSLITVNSTGETKTDTNGITKTYKAFTISSDSPKLYRVLVTQDQNDGYNQTLVAKAYGVTDAVVEGGSTTYSKKIAILDTYMNSGNGYHVYISVANVSTNNTGFSAWSSMYRLTTSGLGEEVTADAVNIVSGTPGTNGTTGASRRQTAPLSITPSSINSIPTQDDATTEDVTPIVPTTNDVDDVTTTQSNTSDDTQSETTENTTENTTEGTTEDTEEDTEDEDIPTVDAIPTDTTADSSDDGE